MKQATRLTVTTTELAHGLGAGLLAAASMIATIALAAWVMSWIL
jgi:hypothetical protein